jgi:hypothetical protein
MKLSDFILLNEGEKKLVMLHEGVLIGKRKKQGYIFFLFQLDGFYVETFGNTQTKNIIEYRMFERTELLHPYLETIAIDDLLRE